MHTQSGVSHSFIHFIYLFYTYVYQISVGRNIGRHVKVQLPLKVHNTI
jgi:hypothetical protein